jgi:hypothetical protein
VDPRAAAFIALAAIGCATAPAPTAVQPAPRAAPEAEAAGEGPAPRPADSAEAVAYYRAAALVLAKEQSDEVDHIDFGRFRRGRLYAGLVMGPGAFAKELSAAFEKNDWPAVLDVTAKILPDDQADLRAHMLRAVALRKLERHGEADFHRAVAMAMLKSIFKTGDGRGPATAWTVFQVREEYEVMKALGFQVESQSLKNEGGKQLDILEGSAAKDGRRVHVYFDISEVFAEEGRAFSGIGAPKP